MVRIVLVVVTVSEVCEELDTSCSLGMSHSSWLHEEMIEVTAVLIMVVITAGYHSCSDQDS